MASLISWLSIPTYSPPTGYPEKDVAWGPEVRTWIDRAFVSGCNCKTCCQALFSNVLIGAPPWKPVSVVADGGLQSLHFRGSTFLSSAGVLVGDAESPRSCFLLVISQIYNLCIHIYIYFDQS